jgi:hypothetical protein
MPGQQRAWRGSSDDLVGVAEHIQGKPVQMSRAENGSGLLARLDAVLDPAQIAELAPTFNQMSEHLARIERSAWNWSPTSRTNSTRR